MQTEVKGRVTADVVHRGGASTCEWFYSPSKMHITIHIHVWLYNHSSPSIVPIHAIYFNNQIADRVELNMGVYYRGEFRVG